MRYARLAPKKPKRNYTSMVLFILLLGAGVYIFCATAAGNWVAKNVVTPVFSYLENGSKQASINDLPDKTKKPPAASTAPAVSAGAKVTQSVSAEGKSYWLLQYGIFDSEENANDAATTLRQRGGAGYIYKDGTRNRVLLAAYGSESDAKSVRDSLERNEGISTYAFSVKMDGLNFAITAGDAQAQALKDGIALPEYTADTLMGISVSYDKGQAIDTDLKALKEKCASVRDGLNAAIKEDEKNEDIVRLKEFNGQLCEIINKLPDTAATGNVEISSQLKYTVIWVALNYSDFMKQLI
jgi:hypothetical protein